MAGIANDEQLAKLSGVHLQTIQGWIYGTHAPRSVKLKKVADALGVTYESLMAKYKAKPQAVPLEDAVLELAAAIRELSASLK